MLGWLMVGAWTTWHAQRRRRPRHDPAEVVDLCRDLIRIDTTNYGDDSGPGERKAAEYVAALLDEVGIEARLYEAEPGRPTSVAHWGGPDRQDGGLLLHGHLDVVPAEPRTGRSTRSRARSATATCGAAARST